MVRLARPLAVGLMALLAACGPSASSTLAPSATRVAASDFADARSPEATAPPIATAPTPTTQPVAPAAQLAPSVQARAYPTVAPAQPLHNPATSGTPVLDRTSGMLQVVDSAGRPIPTMSYNLTVYIWAPTSANGRQVWIMTQRRLYSNCCLPVQLNISGGAWTVQGAVSNGWFTRWVDFRSDPGPP